jgi:excisionase family DNA binding protein
MGGEKVAAEVAGTARKPIRLALTVQEAADSLGVSRRHFDRHIAPRLRLVFAGGRKLVPIRELECYLNEHGV